MNKCKDQDFRNWELNLGIGILNNYLKIEVLKIGILKNYLKMEFLKINK